MNWFKQFLFVHTVQLCNKHIYYNHKIFHKKPPGKTSFFVAEEKSTGGQRKNSPTAAPCGLAPTQSSPPGLRSILASTISPYSNCLSTTFSCTRAGPPHTLLVIDALGSWQIRASFLRAYNCNLSTGR